jgi:L-aminopeptidase/D-esterase-like protein
MSGSQLNTTRHVPSPSTPSIVATAGHDTDLDAQTGCTVVLFEQPALTVVDVRGGAPGTRETDLLAPGRLVRRADAILLSGGSAFGLAAADGVMRFLANNGRGVATADGHVPIVPSAILYDLSIGQPVSPDADSGERACAAAEPLRNLKRGRVGAGTGATSGKIRRPVLPRRGGLGLGSWSWSAGSVTAIVVVNAYGVVNTDRDHDQPNEADDPRELLFDAPAVPELPGQSTTLAVLLIDAPTDYSTLVLCTVAAHNAIARRIVPSHTLLDGDIAFASALQETHDLPLVEALRIGVAAELAVERAIIDAVIS